MRERGLPFDDVATLDWKSAIVRQDTRKDYGEDRYRALAEGLDGNPFVVMFTMRGATTWIVSFRRAHEKERHRGGKTA
ncbi:MAG: BrnT family toxin [Acetobacteraceae bacterium]|nr:BrnT family toxin [Acetobacteraceae bacterium]